MRVTLPPTAQGPGQTTRYSLVPATSKALTPMANAPGFFTGAAAGTVKVVVSQTPSCPPGNACPAHVVNIGSVTVTVWG
jgi:hypothetical protein